MAKKETLKDLTKKAQEIESIPKKLPVLALRDIVIYPNMIFPVLVGRESSLKTVAEAMERDKFIFLVAQQNATIDEPGKDDIYRYGTVAKVIQILRLPNNLMKVLVDGVVQGHIKKFTPNEEIIEAEIELYPEQSTAETDFELQASIRHVSALFRDYVKENHNIPPEVNVAFENIQDPIRKLYYAAANVQQKVDVKQKILDKFNLKEQYFELAAILMKEIELLHIEEDLDVKVHESIQKAQRKFIIQEQIRALQQELGDEEVESTPELAKIREGIEQANLPKEVKEKVMEEFDKLRRTPQMSPEFGVLRNYLDWIITTPWHEQTADMLDVERVGTILDEDHYGLEKVKDRILEYISVLHLVRNVHGQVLCFVGPPGVGKTSLARSIARALGRKFVRMSLGGVRDEAEIRGHRRTYIGSMPGKIIQSMKRAGTVNPVILLDEVDKMSMDFRGDPSSALLEVLDPEQNSTFNDHFIEVDYDLSKVLFITTANVKYDIPLPLLDRMEVIELTSYLEHEKLEIARGHIVRKQLEKQGLGSFAISFTDEALLTLIREYTKEAGVRSLERQISSVLRKIAKKVVLDIAYEVQHLPKNWDKTAENQKPKAERKSKKKVEAVEQSEAEMPEVPVEKPEDAQWTAAKNIVAAREYVITKELVNEFLKVAPFRQKKQETEDKVGVATGLAWTSVGGDILPVEVTIMPGKEQLTLTGKLGDVMKESGVAALSFVRSNASALSVPENFYKEKEIHVHVPEGAIPKDGPSAGITMTLALISAASGRALRGDVAMTGEVTLRGNILAIGGLNEKLVAAKRAGKTTVLVPRENEPELADMSPHITDGLTLVPVAHILEALPVAFR